VLDGFAQVARLARLGPVARPDEPRVEVWLALARLGHRSQQILHRPDLRGAVARRHQAQVREHQRARVTSVTRGGASMTR
jgi:hypothetical protein